MLVHAHLNNNAILVSLLGLITLLQATKAYIPVSDQSFRKTKARFSKIPSFAPTEDLGMEIIARRYDFDGHECYAETYPAIPPEKPNLAEKTGRFWFGGGNLTPVQKPEIVLIHGFGCSTSYWRATRKSLTSAGYVVHALDLLGQGKSAKPGRKDGIEYSINLWAELVDEYCQQFVPQSSGVVVMGNSLGSVVALSAATGDFGPQATLPYRIQGIGMFNCGIGMNSRNILRDPSLNGIQKALFTFLFDILDKLLFDNLPLLTYVLEHVVTKELLRNALLGLYQCAPDPESCVDDELVESFYTPAKDPGSPEALNQIYTNDAGKTPMELHADHKIFLNSIPIHLVWGTQDGVTPIMGPVGDFYLDLVKQPKQPVSISVVEAGHIPFDEVPECNEFMVQWLEEVVAMEIDGPPNRNGRLYQ